jgi:hypothetical protein
LRSLIMLSNGMPDAGSSSLPSHGRLHHQCSNKDA